MAIEDIDLLKPGQSKFFFTKGGDISFIDIINEIVNARSKKCEMVLSTWRIGKRDIAVVSDISNMPGVHLRLMVDASMTQVSRRGEWDMLKRDMGGSVWLTKNHTKIFTMSPDWVVLTSANLNKNTRLEYFSVSRDAKVYKKIQSGLKPFFKQRPGIKRSDYQEIKEDFDDHDDTSGSFGKKSERYRANVGLIMDTGQVAKVWNITEQAVRLWAKNGCPKAARGRYDIRDVLEWWLENIYVSKVDGGKDITEAKTEYWQAKARNETVKADEAEGIVAKKADFIQAWAWRLSEVSGGLGSIAMRIAPLVAGKTELETRKIIDDEMWKIRDKFSRTGKFTPDIEG